MVNMVWGTSQFFDTFEKTPPKLLIAINKVRGDIQQDLNFNKKEHNEIIFY